MGIEEGTCWDEHWVLYVSDESWESTPKTKSTLYTPYVSQFLKISISLGREANYERLLNTENKLRVDKEVGRGENG